MAAPNSGSASSQRSDNASNVVANLPYPALKNIFWYLFTEPGEALATCGTVCSHWRSILAVTGPLWEQFVAARWPGTAPENRTFETFVARMKQIHNNLRPIRARDTTAIEECDFAFRCPMLIENLSLVQPAALSTSERPETGPIYHCSVCDKHVYTVRTQEEKQKCAQERKCVVFHRSNLSSSAAPRIRVALVSAFDDNDELVTAAGVRKAQRALCEVRAVADSMRLTSTVSVKDRVIIDLRNAAQGQVVTEFRHVFDRDLWDAKKLREYQREQNQPQHAPFSNNVNTATSTTSTANKQKQPFVPDVVLHVDNNNVKPNFAATRGSIFGIRLGHTTASVANFGTHATAPTMIPNQWGDNTTPMAAAFGVETSSWDLGPAAVVKGVMQPNFFVPDLLSVLAMVNRPRLQAYLRQYPHLGVASTKTESSSYDRDGIFLIDSDPLPLPQHVLENLQRLGDTRKSGAATRVKTSFQFDIVVNSQKVAQISAFELGVMMLSNLREMIMDFAPPGSIQTKLCGGEDQFYPKVGVSMPQSIRFAANPSDDVSDVLLAALDYAKLEHVRTMSNDTVACIAAGVDRRNTQGAVVRALHIHVGGSTFEASVIECDEGIFEVLSTIGPFKEKANGGALDEILRSHVLDTIASNSKHGGQQRADAVRSNARAMRRLRRNCEAARRSLDTLTVAHVELDELLPGWDLSLQIVRSKFEALAHAEFQDAVTSVINMVRSASGNNNNNNTNAAQQIDTIVLSGGCSKTPKFIQMLDAAFPRVAPVTMPYQPNVISAAGAAIQGAILCGTRDGSKSKPKPICASYQGGVHAVEMAVAAAEPDDTGFLMGLLDVVVLTISIGDCSSGAALPIIARNRIFPVRKSMTLLGSQLFKLPRTSNSGGDDDVGTAAAAAAAAASSASNTSTVVNIYEGERARYADNNLLARIHLPEPVDDGSEVEITVDMDPNAIVTCSAVEIAKPQNHGTVIITNDAGRLSQADIEEMVRDAERFKYEDDLLRERVEAKNLLENAVFGVREMLLHPPSSSSSSSPFTLSEESKLVLANAVENTLKHLEANPLITKEESAKKRDELMDLVRDCVPDLEQLQISAGGGGMPGGMPGGTDDVLGSLPGPSSSSPHPPVIEEVD